MQALDQHLVRRDRGLVQLLDPPFDKGDLNPGYIKGYLPGVRENGGQYTHSAIWATMAFARMGDTRRAWELFQIINPVNHARTAAEAAIYKVEPYVVAADVYALSPHTGRGGWTWYTGSAGWMYRLVTESLLGIRLEVDRLHIEPRLPAGWTGFKIHYRYRETVYHIDIMQAGPALLTIDDKPHEGTSIPLVDDRQEHSVQLKLGGDPL
jgi:cellobiose phosphorylase